MEAVFLMASAGAIAILADRLVAAVRSLVLIRAVVIRMTAGAVWLERRILPNNDLGIVLVTIGAGEVAAMVQRFERRGCVSEVVGYERIGVVAEVAFNGCYKVPLILADRGYSVVTRRARAENLCVVNVQYRLPNSRRMAVFTNVRCKDVLRIFAGCDCAVVAAKTIAVDIGVVEVCRQPRD